MADTLLATLVRQRRLTQDETIDALRRRARQLEIPENRFDLSVRQLQRWVAGQVRLPHPMQCRVLEAEFRHPVEELLAAPPEPRRERDGARRGGVGRAGAQLRARHGRRRASAGGPVEHT